MNKVEIKKEGDTLVRVYIDGIEVKGLKKYKLIDTCDPINGRKQELILVIGDFKDLNVF